MNIVVNTSIIDYIYIRLNRIQRFFKKKKYLFFQKKIKKIVESAEYEYGLNTAKRDRKIIVSLTTYPKRFKTIHLCLKSLLLQTVKPDKIIIYLGSDSKNEKLDDLLFFKQFGVEILLKIDEDLKPHKKYLYAMQDYPEDIIITVDDDCIYNQKLIESLLKTHKKHPDCVEAARVHKIMRKHDKSLHSYNNWINNYTLSTKPAFNLIATGCGGILYPPHCFKKGLFDKEMIMKYCLRADDIWLKYNENLSNIKIVWAKNSCPEPLSIETSQTVSLSKENVGLSKNDEYIEKLKSLFCLEIDNKGTKTN